MTTKRKENFNMEHTEAELKIMAEYEKSTDFEVKGFIEDVVEGKDKLNYITVAFLSSEAEKKIEELTSKHIEGTRVVLDVNAVKHILNRHGANGKQDTSMSNIDDIARIGYVIANYDEISFDGMTTPGYLDESGNPAPMIKISKKIDGTYYVVEAVNSSKKKKNYIVTAYIRPNKKQQSDPC